jgi:hypothetical protein
MRALSFALAALLAFTQTGWAFCGFYVATSSEPLTNKASRVVIAHADDRTAVTMASDVGGDPKEFAIVIPVPTVIKREQVQIVHAETVAHLANYTKPRLVEYHDPDPCAPVPKYVMQPSPMGAAMPPPTPPATVRIEAQFSVEEYDIVVLSATDSGDLLTYLDRSGYKMPRDALGTVGSYLRQNMHFFLAKVNLARMKNNTSGFLRPIQVEYTSRKFMLPIRLGTVNATGPQDMIVLTLTQNGRVEPSNYRTVRMPTGSKIPGFVRDRFGEFYDSVFERSFQASGGDAVFLEYAWHMGSCDPCVGTPMSNTELRELGAKWVPEDNWQQPAFVTRLHVRYDREHFPEDLFLQETRDTESYQARYVIRNTFKGNLSCPAGETYEAGLPARFAREAATLRDLSGWTPQSIKAGMEAEGQKLP